MGEGETEEGTVVYPDDPKRRIEIVWRDRSHRRRPVSLRFGTGSANRTYFGIGAGTDLATLERLNGRPFLLAGFDWDYSGTVTSWEGGRLEKVGDGRCTLYVRLYPKQRGERTRKEEVALEATSGDADFSSANRNMRLLNPRVYQVVIEYE
jgi:hypothetical protein